MFEVAVGVGCCNQGYGIALGVVSAAGYCTVLAGCCVNKQVVGAEVLQNNLVVDSNLHILEVECSAFVGLGIELIEVYSNTNVLCTFFANCSAPRYVSPAAVGYLISCKLDSAVVSISIDKLGVFFLRIVPVTISILVSYHHNLGLVATIKAVPIYIEIELEFVASFLAFQT